MSYFTNLFVSYITIMGREIIIRKIMYVNTSTAASLALIVSIIDKSNGLVSRLFVFRNTRLNF